MPYAKPPWHFSGQALYQLSLVRVEEVREGRRPCPQLGLAGMVAPSQCRCCMPGNSVYSLPCMRTAAAAQCRCSRFLRLLLRQARKYMPPELPLVSLFGWTLGGFYLARYSGAHGAFLAYARHCQCVADAYAAVGLLAALLPGCCSAAGQPARAMRCCCPAARCPAVSSADSLTMPLLCTADSPAGAFDELVALAGLAWDFPTSAAWAARVYVNSREASAAAGATAGVGLPCPPGKPACTS